MKKNSVCFYLKFCLFFSSQQTLILFSSVIGIFILTIFVHILELNIDPERHTYENIPYTELDDETYKKWKEDKKKGSKKNNKCCCD